jgi:hypothetical protein
MKKHFQKPIHLRKKPKHVLSVLRKVIGIKLPGELIKNHSEFKNAIGIAGDTVRSIQSGRLPFSETSALAVTRATGVSLKWLLALDGSKPPATETGQPFTKETFQRHQAQCGKDVWDPMQFNLYRYGCFQQFRSLTMKLAALIVAAYQSQKVGFINAKLDAEMKRLAKVIRESGRVHAFASARKFDPHGRMIAKSALWEQIDGIPADSEAGLIAIFNRLKEGLPAEKKVDFDAIHKTAPRR